MKRTNKNRQAEYLQTGKSERTAVRAAKCVTDYGHENTDVDFRKDKGRDKPLSTFLQASEIKTRQCIYISREIHEKVAIVTSRMGNSLWITSSATISDNTGSSTWNRLKTPKK